MEVSGKVILITGASGGMGSRTALKLAAEGASLALTGRDADRLTRTEKACYEVQEGLSRGKIYTVPGDMREEGTIKQIIDKTIKYFGRIDVVIHAAGGTRLRNFYSCELEDLDWSFNITVKPAFILSKLVTPHLEKTQGTMIFVSSLAGLRPFSFNLPFSTASAGLHELTKLATQIMGSKGIRVHSFNPATTDTDFFSNAFEATHGKCPTPETIEKHEEVCSKSFPLGRIGCAEECANILSFLCTDHSSFLHGHVLPYDGGYQNTSYIPIMAPIKK